jgi:flagellar L-ring protein precursor FlgH
MDYVKTISLIMVRRGNGISLRCTANDADLKRTGFRAGNAGDASRDHNRNGSIFADSNARYRFGFKKNFQVGDIITVVLTEATQAQRQSGVETTREGTNSPLKALQGAFALDSNRLKRATKAIPFDDLTIESRGSGTANQAASLSGAIAATVIQVLPNESLLIKGQKRLTLSEGSETIQLLGLVDQRDVQPDNTVLSSRLANARISYEGSGDLSAVAKVPWGTNLVNKLWPF